MKSLWLKTGVVASAALCSVAAFAQTTSTTTVPASPAISGQTAASANISTLDEIKKHFSAFDWSEWFGPGLSDPGQHQSADSSIDAKNPLFLRNDVFLNYKLTKNTNVGPVVEFDLVQNDLKYDPSSEGFRMRDAFIRSYTTAAVDTMIGSNHLTIDGGPRWYFPTSYTSRRVTDKIGALRLDMNPNLQFGKTKWSLTVWNYAKGHFYGDGGDQVTAPRDAFALYTGPQLNYEFNPIVTGFVLYEAEAVWNGQGKPDYANYANSNTDIEPGAMINVSKSVMLMPALNWYTNQSVGTTSFLLSAAITFL